jgi:hypothetical protein
VSKTDLLAWMYPDAFAIRPAMALQLVHHIQLFI